MKTKFIYSLTFIIFITLTVVSCKKEDCTCPANTGNSNTTPTDEREQYEGNYIVNDTTTIDAGSEIIIVDMITYVLTISIDEEDENGLIFHNLWNDGTDQEAILAGDFISFPSQQITGSSYGFDGSGSFNGNFITYETDTDEIGGNVLHNGTGEKQ